MPIYNYECDTCKKVHEEFRKIAERDNVPLCCGKPTVKIISSYAVVGDVEPYYDDNLESFVKSKQHRKKLMKDRGVYERYGKRWM